MPSHAPSAIPALRSTLSPSKCGRLGEKEESWAVKNKGDAILRCVGIALIVGKVHSVGGPPARVRDKRRESRAFMEEETLQAPRRAVHPNLPATSLNTFHVLDVMFWGLLYASLGVVVVQVLDPRHRKRIRGNVLP